jgi:hypothetical protein
MSYCKKILGLALVLALQILVWVSATGNAQQDARGAAWIEGANTKVNHDATAQLQNEEACAINPNNPDNVVAIWRDFRLDYRRIGVGTTFDAGVTWSDSLLIGRRRFRAPGSGNELYRRWRHTGMCSVTHY